MQSVRVREDLDGSHTWHRIEETFEQVDGQNRLVARLTFNDDGTVEQDTFVDDVVRHRVVANNEKLPLGSQIDPWDQVEYRYDADGAQQQATTFYLSGKIRDQWQASAVPVEKTEKLAPVVLDGVDDGAWKSVTVTYAKNGQIDQRDYVFEDGATRTEHYHRGALNEVLHENAPDGATGWASTLTAFNPDGLVVRRLTITEDGQETEETFVDGKPVGGVTSEQPASVEEPEEETDAIEEPIALEVRTGVGPNSAPAEAQLGDTGLSLSEAFDVGSRTKATPVEPTPVLEEQSFLDPSDSFIFETGG